ncbi:MAG: hypothetical protein AAGJ82_15925 [Bacteroidota bacterium]
MAKSSFDRLLTLVKRYQYILWAGGLIFSLCVGASLWIYYHLDNWENQIYWDKLAEFLMEVGQTMLGAVLIGGGLGGVFNFIIEEQKKEEDAVKERLKSMQDSRDQRRAFRRDIRRRLQQVHDDVELARVLIKSHRSGRTYGEEIRAHIMPSNIALQDIKKQLLEVKDAQPVRHIQELHVSLTFMSAYLSVLIAEFSKYYLEIANIQQYQDTLAERRRQVFSRVLEQNVGEQVSPQEQQQAFIDHTHEHFQTEDIPDRMEAVWKAMGQLDYVWDFIGDLRSEAGKASNYQSFFIDHHFHCFRLLRDSENSPNEELCTQHDFTYYLQQLERLTAKKKSDEPITKQDSLTRMVMVRGLGYGF